MHASRELKALLRLIDDPDSEVFAAITDRMIELGSGIIPHLEYLWEGTACIETQEKVENLIHKVQFTELNREMLEWSGSPYHDLLFGSILAAKYQYPQLHTTPLLQEIDKIKRNIWLELNDFLTPLEKANIMSKMLYGYYKIQSNELTYSNADDFFLNKVIEKKQGNAVSIGILYQIMADLLDINASIISIPKQIIIAYYHSDFYAADSLADHRDYIQFYVDACNGNAYSYSDIKKYLQANKLKPQEEYFKPMSHKRIVQVLLEEIGKCFYYPQVQYKQKEVETLVTLLQ